MSKTKEPASRRKGGPLKMTETELKYLYLAVAKCYNTTSSGASGSLWNKFNDWDPNLLSVALADKRREDVTYD